MKRERFNRLMHAWGWSSDDATWEALRAAYGEKHRHYHSGAHIEACLRHLDHCAGTLQRAREVELALWFHDAVYRPLSSTNERRSADWALQFLRTHAADPAAAMRIDGLIMATRHDAPVGSGDMATMVDIDLAILGADPEAYLWYEQAVRREYRWVPARLYRKGRARLLQQFLDRPCIYQTSAFSGREAAAQNNLAAAIRRL